MSQTTKRLSGRCLCGGVRFEADFSSTDVGACHCDICRRWAAGPFMVIDGARNVVFSGTDDLATYASSAWGERGFCKACGTSLFWRSLDGEHYALSANAVEEAGDLAFTTEIFIDSKPGYYDFANDTRKMTGAEVLAAFADKGQ